MKTLTTPEFRALLDRFAALWGAREYRMLVEHFAPDVHYADPLRYRLEGRAALFDFFDNDEGLPQSTVWHTTMFDEATQTGTAEYTYTGTHRYHGVAIVRLHDGLVTHWREYQHVDARDWNDYVGTTRFD